MVASLFSSGALPSIYPSPSPSLAEGLCRPSASDRPLIQRSPQLLALVLRTGLRRSRCGAHSLLRPAALPTGRTPFVTKNPLFWSRNFQQTPSVPRNGCFWARTPRRTHSDGQGMILCLGPCPHFGLPGTSGGQDTRLEIRPCPLKCRGKGLAYKDPSLTLRMTIIVQQLND